MKGWFYESWRHSLAAKGISTRKNYAFKDILADWRAGVRSVEEKKGVAMRATQPMKIPGTESALAFSEEERKAMDQKKMELALGMRERRFQETRKYMDKYPIAQGESVNDYMERLRQELGEGVWQSWALGGEDESFRYINASGKMTTKKGRMTVGDYVKFVLERDAAYNAARSPKEQEEAKRKDREEAMRKEYKEEAPGFGFGKKVVGMRIGSVGILPEDTTLNFIFEDGTIQAFTYISLKDKIKQVYGPDVSEFQRYVNGLASASKISFDIKHFLDAVINDIREGK